MSDKKDDSGLNHEDSLAQQRHAEILRLAKLDVVVDELANGCYTIPASPDRPSYDLRKLSEYAKKSGRDPSELTDEELEQFIIPKSPTFQRYKSNNKDDQGGQMTIKGQINALLQAIESQGGPAREKEVIGNLVAQASKYIEIVVKQGFAAQVGESQEELIRIDQSRTRAHNSLISQIDIINRLCQKYGLEPVYTGPDERRAKGDWAMQMVHDYFDTRS